jgi:glycosyltransferase involved in cell wall biosynthesis
MKLLHFICSDAFGGMELYVKELLVQQKQAGYELAVLTKKNTRLANELKELAIPIFYIPKNASKFSLPILFKIKKIVAEENITHIHTHNNIDIWMASWYKCIFNRSIRHVNSTYMIMHKNKHKGHYQFLYHFVDGISSTSALTNQSIMKNIPIDKHKITLIPYGRSVHQFVSQEALRNTIRNQYQAQDKMVVAMLSRIDQEKGNLEFAQSYLKLPTPIQEQVQYWIIGEPTMAFLDSDGKPVYEAQSQATENAITGIVTSNHLENKIIRIPFQKEYIAYLDAIDIFVLPSYNEMYSLSLLDAMLMKKPIIGTNTGGTPEQLGDGERGLLMEARDTDAIAHAVEALIMNRALANQKATHAYEWAIQTHAWDATLKKYEAFYKIN